MRSPFGFARRLVSLIAAATVAPTLAASPVLLAGLAAYLSESSAYSLYVAVFFQLIVMGIAVTVIVGVPLHAVFSRLRLRGSWVYIIAGALLAAATYALQSDYAWTDYAQLWHDGGEWFWSALVLFGALTGWLFARRIHRGVK